VGLWQFIARRIIQSVVVLFFVSVATFLLMHAVPGDPLVAVIGERQADRPEIRAALEKRYSLDKPLPVQYISYVRNIIVNGDMGSTITTRRPVADELAKFIPFTIELSIGAMIFALGLGVPLGIISALRQNKWQDHIARFVSLIGTAMPVFWLGLLLSYLISYKLRWLPRSGFKETGMKIPEHVTGFMTIDAVLAGVVAGLATLATSSAQTAMLFAADAPSFLAREGADYLAIAADGTMAANMPFLRETR